MDTRLGRSVINQTEDITIEQRIWRNDDPLYLQNTDHPEMILVTTDLIGNNYLSWSRSMKIAVGAKVKLGFINGKIKRTDEGSPDFEQMDPC